MAIMESTLMNPFFFLERKYLLAMKNDRFFNILLLRF